MGNSFPQSNLHQPNYSLSPPPPPPNFYPVYNQPYHPYIQQPNFNPYYNNQMPINQPYNFQPYGQGMGGSMGPRGGGWGKRF